MPDDTAASISYVQSAPVTCPTCGRAFTFDVWLIVDAAERPDLMKRIRRGTLHTVACPNCGQPAGEADRPLLLYRPNAELAILFSPAGRLPLNRTKSRPPGWWSGCASR